MYWCIYIYIEQTASLNKLTFKANQRLQTEDLAQAGVVAVENTGYMQ